MGTNFYIKKPSDDYAWDERANPSIHIGKRSAAGMYCWDCNITLCADGEEYVHQCHHVPSRDVRYIGDYKNYPEVKWHKKCPKCGKAPEDEGWNGTAGRELGFNKDTPAKKTGVASCSSFTWAMKPDKFYKEKDVHVWDEYGREYTNEEFEQVLEECPIRYYHSVGVEFS